MENNQINYQPKNKWKVAGIILIVVSAILIGFSVYLAVKINAKDKSSVNNSAQADTSCKNTETSKNKSDEENLPVITDENNSVDYLSVTDWGIKIKTDFADMLNFSHIDGEYNPFNEKEAPQLIRISYSKFEGTQCSPYIGGFIGMGHLNTLCTSHATQWNNAKNNY
ncbi:MAG: hypothetical protein LBJ12_02245 [Oscillospiraceae bacterium]|jgi:hypothetical protein|nr:hypothetical protein [Oscillospiraceae bacterium]